MMINHNKKLIFIHVPKTAGNSVKPVFGMKGHFHGRAKWITQALPDYFSFAFVRNPWDRCVSAYHYLTQGGMGTTDERAYKKIIQPLGSTFDEVLNHPNFPNVAKRQMHFRPMHWYINAPVDFIGHVERFDEDMKKLCKLLNTERSLKLTYEPKLKNNSSSHEHYTSYYTDKTKEIVANIYSEDIKLFNYNFV